MGDLEERLAEALWPGDSLYLATHRLTAAMESANVHLVENVPLREHGVARATDPQTSHDAGRSVTTSKVHDGVRYVLGAWPMGMTDEVLGRRLRAHLHLMNLTDASVRSRRKELVDAGEVKDSGRTAQTSRGRKAVVWTLA